MRTFVNREMFRPLTGDEVEEITGYKIRKLIYDDLKNMKNINQLFQKKYNNACLILYRTTPNSGHWVAITKDHDGINFIDSYGEPIDDQLGYTAVRYDPELCRLLVNYKGSVNYNDIPLQKMKDKISTCGRWCALWMQYRDMGIDNFSKTLNNYKNKIDLDELVTLLTS